MRPKSSAPVLIWRRSIARIVPSLIGRTYCLPVRLSVTVRVSAMQRIGREGLRISGLFRIARRRLLVGYPVLFAQPAIEVGELAPLAAERPPGRLRPAPAAHHAPC